MSTLEKAVRVLQLVGTQGCITPIELAKALKLPKSTAYRLILSLTKLGLLERLGTGDGFILGSLIRELAGDHAAGDQLYYLARAHMMALRDECGETVGLHTVRNGQRILLGQEVSAHEHRWVFSNVKVPMPLHAGAASKMLLAELPERDVLSLLKNDLTVLTAHTPRDRTRLLKELGRIRAQGYAISHEEVVAGIASIAVPIATTQQGPFVLSVTGPSLRLSDAAMKVHLRTMRECSLRISAQAGVKLKPVKAAG